jgi:hypothetical protein
MNESDPELPDKERGVPYDVSALEQVRRTTKAAIERGELRRDAAASEIVDFTINELVMAKLIRPQAIGTVKELERAQREGFGSPPSAGPV